MSGGDFYSLPPLPVEFTGIFCVRTQYKTFLYLSPLVVVSVLYYFRTRCFVYTLLAVLLYLYIHICGVWGRRHRLATVHNIERIFFLIVIIVHDYE